MVLEGQVKNGQIVLDQPARLPEGTRVRVQVVTSLQAIAERLAEARARPDSGPTLAERYASVIGTAVDLPPDLAERHDHYIHGSDR
ncbi:MAG: hypothetical protein J2P46_08620 [Zavarzinella sp.]|nr:hypothetical protein [Zavarzinella sp.]